MKNQTCCFTGHRILPTDQLEKIRNSLKQTIIELIGQGYQYFCAGGALGFDTLAAQIVLELKSIYPHIKLILVLPCHDQTRGWNPNDIETYENIKQKADRIVYTSNKYTPGCMHKRNRHLVDNSSICICYLRKPTGGTAYTVKYAKQKNVQTISIS